MAEHTPHQDPRHELEDLPGLGVSLRALHAPPFRVPAEIDARVLADARRALGPSLGRAKPALAWWRVMAAAAGIGLAALPVYWWSRTVAPARPPVRTVLAGDLDSDGRVDIVDAMVLAAALEGRGGGAGVEAGARDINGDGVADRYDVDAVALLAVRLDGGGT